MDPVTAVATVDVNPLINYAMEAAIALIALFGSWALVKVAKYFNVQTDDAFQDRIHNLIWDGLHASKGKYAEEIKAAGMISVRNKIVADVAAYVLENGGKEIKKLGYDDPTKLAKAVRDRLHMEASPPMAPVS